MSTNYADAIKLAQQNAALKTRPPKGEKKKRDSGLAADIAAELHGAIADDAAVDSVATTSPAVSVTQVEPAPLNGVAADPTIAAEATAELPIPKPPSDSQSYAIADPPKTDDDPESTIVRQGVDFRRAHLDLITEMLYRCYKQKIKLPGKKGPSVIVRAAIDELAKIYAEDPAQFDEIMTKYATRKPS